MATKRAFEQHADRETNTIPKSQVIAVLIALGADPESFTKGSVEEIMQKANLDVDDVIDFKEFLITAAVGCFLRADPSTTELSPCFLSIRKGFEAAKKVFASIDRDRAGEIDFQELEWAFLAMPEGEIIMERVRGLDFNGDKSIDFPAFVWALSAWVGPDEDLGDEEVSNLLLPPDDIAQGDVPQEDVFYRGGKEELDDEEPAPDEQAICDEQRDFGVGDGRTADLKVCD